MSRSNKTRLIPGGSRHTRSSTKKIWIAPVVAALVALALAGVALTLDHVLDWSDAPPPIFVGDPDTARTSLSVIAGAVATFVSLIFTVIAVVIQLAIGQYTPRALSILLGDRPTHLTIGVFVGTFAYALAVLLGLRIATEDDVTSGLAVTFAFVLAAVAIVTFAIFANHIIHSVRASSLIQRIGGETRAAIDALYSPFGEPPREEVRPEPPSGGPHEILRARENGVFVNLDEEKLFDIARRSGGTLVITPPIGAYVPEGGELIAVHGASVDPQTALDAIELTNERDLRLDVAFGLRQLMDIAARALSSGINDPATAVQVLDELHDLLRRITLRQLPDGVCYDDAGKARVIVRLTDWDGVILLTLDEFRRLGAGTMPVMRRLRAVLDDLRSIAPPFRQEALKMQLQLLDEVVEAGFSGEFERELGRVADVRGTGL
jgi:uncharacterized membrane protein